jgi:hypothetical protein
MESNQTKKYFRVLTLSEQKERMKIIRSGAYVTAGVTGTDNYARFSSMKPETARRLISEGFANPEDSQNGAPTFEQMTAFCESHPGFVLDGYVIGGDRADARVTADTVRGEPTDADTQHAFLELFRYADEIICTCEKCFCWYD